MPTRPRIADASLRGNRIKAELKKRKMLQKELAKECGVSLRQVNRVVLGVCEPSFVLAKRMSEALKVPMDKLFDFRAKRRATKLAPADIGV